MKISGAFPGDYLKAADIGNNKVKATIASCEMCTVGEEDKPLLRFKDKERGLVLNKTNANILAQELGDETDNWIGADLLLYSAKVNYQGNIVDGIRVEVSAQAPEPAKPPMIVEDDVPF